MVALEEIRVFNASHKLGIIHLPVEVYYSVEGPPEGLQSVSEAELTTTQLQLGVLPDLCVGQNETLKSLETLFQNRLSLSYAKVQLEIILGKYSRKELISELRKKRDLR